RGGGRTNATQEEGWQLSHQHPHRRRGGRLRDRSAPGRRRACPCSRQRNQRQPGQCALRRFGGSAQGTGTLVPAGTQLSAAFGENTYGNITTAKRNPAGG